VGANSGNGFVRALLVLHRKSKDNPMAHLESQSKTLNAIGEEAPAHADMQQEQEESGNEHEHGVRIRNPLEGENQNEVADVDIFTPTFRSLLT